MCDVYIQHLNYINKSFYIYTCIYKTDKTFLYTYMAF